MDSNNEIQPQRHCMFAYFAYYLPRSQSLVLVLHTLHIFSTTTIIIHYYITSYTAPMWWKLIGLHCIIYMENTH